MGVEGAVIISKQDRNTVVGRIGDGDVGFRIVVKITRCDPGRPISGVLARSVSTLWTM